MAMNKQRRSSNISNIFSYDDAGNIVIKDYGQVTRYSWNGLIHGFVGPVSVSSVSAATTDTDRFLVSDGGVLKYRTGVELLSDIGGVPSTRTLTINGVTQDLSVNRTFTIAAGISGSGADGQVAYWNGTNSQTGSNNLFWDATNARLGIGTNAPGFDLSIVKSTSATISLQSTSLTGFSVLDIYNSAGVQIGGLGYGNSGTFSTFANKIYLASISTPISIILNSIEKVRFFNNGNVLIQNGGTYTDNGFLLDVAGTARIQGNTSLISSGTTELSIRTTSINQFAALNFYNSAGTQIGGVGYGNTSVTPAYAGKFYFAGANNVPFSFLMGGTEYVRLFYTGNLVLQNGGTFTDGGQRLQVYGDAFVRGSGATSATSALLVQNSAGTAYFRLINDGRLQIGSDAHNTLVFPFATTDTPSLTSRNLMFYSTNGTQIASEGRFKFNGTSFVQTSGTVINLESSSIFEPTSGTSTFQELNISPQVSQTGGANGITRGLYVNPTITAAADWRSIEWSNNSGWGLYGAGTANNFLGGDLTFASSKGVYFASSALGFFGDAGIGSLTFRTNSTSRLTIDNGGNINAPNAPSATFSNIFITGSNIEFRNGVHFFSWENNGSRFQIKNITNANTIPFAIFAGTNNISVGSITDAGFKFDVNGTARVSDQITSSKTSGSAFTMNANAFFQYSNNDILSATAFNIIGGGTSGFGIRYASAAVFGTGTIGCQYFTTNNATFYAGSISVNLGALVNASAVLQCESTTKGFLPPRMTTTQKNAIGTPVAGLVVYDSTTNVPNYYDGTAWVAMGGGGASIYTANGTLTSNRTVSSGGFSLVFNPQTAFVTTLSAATNDSTTALVSQNTLSYASGFSSTNIGSVYGAVAGINRQTFAGSATFEQANLATAAASVNSIDFSATGATITMLQPVSSGIRAMTGHQSQIQYQGTNSGTVTHAAVSQNLGFYRPSAATGTLTITNAYSLLINDLNDYSSGFTFTNRWAIYQDGASDNNYFKGKVVIGSTNTVGASPLNVKNLPTSATGLATGDIWNNGGVLNVV